VMIGPILGLIMAKNKNLLVSCSSDRSVKFFDLESLKQIGHLENLHKGNWISNILRIIDSITSITITADDRYVITGSADKSIRFLDVSSMKEHDQITKAHTS